MFDAGECADVAFSTHTSDAAAYRRGAIDEVRSRALSWGRSIAGRIHRSPRLVVVLLAVVCTSACHSTAVDRLNVRAEPTTASRVIDNLDIAGTSVMVDCFVHGQAIHGNTLWYRIDQPRTGYVSGYYVNSDDNDAAPSC
jgi:Bacterial SH3 domain